MNRIESLGRTICEIPTQNGTVYQVERPYVSIRPFEHIDFLNLVPEAIRGSRDETRDLEYFHQVFGPAANRVGYANREEKTLEQTESVVKRDSKRAYSDNNPYTGYAIQQLLGVRTNNIVGRIAIGAGYFPNEGPQASQIAYRDETPSGEQETRSTLNNLIEIVRYIWTKFKDLLSFISCGLIGKAEEERLPSNLYVAAPLDGTGDGPAEIQMGDFLIPPLSNDPFAWAEHEERFKYVTESIMILASHLIGKNILQNGERVKRLTVTVIDDPRTLPVNDRRVVEMKKRVFESLGLENLGILLPKSIDTRNYSEDQRIVMGISAEGLAAKVEEWNRNHVDEGLNVE